MAKPWRIVVISSCTSSKVGRAPQGELSAEDLYDGEQHRRLMRGVRAYRCAHPASALALWIISAKHGLIRSSARVESYDATFSGSSAAELGNRANELGIPAAVRRTLSRTYDLALLLLGTDYARAADLSNNLRLGGPTFAFVGTAGANRLAGLPRLVTVPAGKAEARRFSCGLVGLKGELAGRLLEEIAVGRLDVDSLPMDGPAVLDSLDRTQQSQLAAVA